MSAHEEATVLVIDDDLAMRKLARIMLRGYRVLETQSMAEGLEVLATEPVDLVLLDISMPGMDGFEGCKAIKAAARGFLPVLILSGRQDTCDVVTALGAGADDFILKPVKAAVLNLRVATFLRLRRQEQEIEGHLTRLRTLVTSKDELVEMLVHDLRNPLTAAACVFRSLEGRVTDPELKEDVRAGTQAVQRAIDLANDLLIVRLLEDGCLEPVHVPNDPLEVVRAATSSLQPMADERNVELRVRGESGLVVPLDQKLLMRAVENLVCNAIKYTRGSVDVSVLAFEGGAEVFVSDRGIGIPERYKPSLFRKYGSVEALSGNARRGVGLGLYMAQLVAAAHHGSIAVEDRLGGGTSFRLRLRGESTTGVGVGTRTPSTSPSSGRGSWGT